MGATDDDGGGAQDAEPTVLVVDNYDSFVYNLVQYVGEVLTDPAWLGRRDGAVVVRRNDAIDVAGVRALDPDAVVVSPGPGDPSDAGVSVPLFEACRYPTLGVCLGHQALCAAAGARVGQAASVVHGKPSAIGHDDAGVFAGLPDPFEGGRYHSLAVSRDGLPAALEESAWTAEEPDAVMAVRHRDRPHVGVQFHPESILTDVGKRLVANFLSAALTGDADRR